jgi:hypothetical protein
MVAGYTHHISVTIADDSARALAPLVGSYTKPVFSVGLLGTSAIWRLSARRRASISFAGTKSSFLRALPRKCAGTRSGSVTLRTPHYCFHRPLSPPLGEFFATGFVLDGLEELQLEESSAGISDLSWANVRDIPAILVARMRQRG